MAKIKYIKTWLAILMLSTLVVSCAAHRNTFGVVGSGSRKEAREVKPQYFVEKTDGSVIVAANDARLRDPLFKKAFIELDKEVRVPLAEVRAYQTSEAYYKMTPMGFAPRVLKGPISQYQLVVQTSTYDPSYYGSVNGRYGGSGYRNTTIIYNFLQKEIDGPMLQPTEPNIRLLVNDYKPSIELLDAYVADARKYKKIGLINTLVAAGGIGVMALGSSMAGNSGDPFLYAGGAMFTGSFVFGFVNRAHKGKNSLKLGDAVLEYNQAYSKKN